jgi:hypothetical protein
MEDVEAGSVLHGNIKGSAFAGLQAAMNPAAVPDSTYFYLDVQPGGTSKGWIANTPDLVAFDGTDNPILANVDLGDIAYGNPYPGLWGEIFDFVHYVRLDYTAPGATNSTTQYAFLALQTTTLPSAASPVVPLIGPVSAPRINAADFFSAQTGVGTTPTLSWSAPSLGAPTGYVVEVFSLSSDRVDSIAEPWASSTPPLRTSSCLPAF